MKNVKNRFLKLISYDTKADHDSSTIPSTKTQLDFCSILEKECIDIGLSNITVSEFGYVMAELPSNIDKKVPVIGFVAHMDTSPDCSGQNIKGVCVPNYDGKDIVLNKEKNIVLSPKEFSSLNNYIGNELIVTDGTTLLGGDDKAGISEILTALEYLVKNPQIKHGTIKVCFTPDEEIGRGADKFDVKAFGADFAYTIDGGEIGELEYESFNAARAKISIIGKSVHPGTAKNIMKNAGLIACELASFFPANETPQTTEEMEGFYHLTSISGNVESAKLDYIIRDFDKENFHKRKKFVVEAVEKINSKYGEIAVLNLYDEYYNMKETFEDKMYIVDIAENAIKEVGLTPLKKSIRGGTDGSRLSFMGLPCPNIFTGAHNGHGPYEYVPVESMEKSCEVIVKICELVCNL